MEGNPRYTIHVSALVVRLAHARARHAGYKTTSDWLRALLWAWNEEPLEPRARRGGNLAVRLSPPLEQRLARIAEVSDTTRAEAFALLVERALLDDAGPTRADSRPEPQRADSRPKAQPSTRPKRTRAVPSTTPPAEITTPAAGAPAIPAANDYPRWAREILAAARATPHTFGRDRAFIAGVLDELIQRFQPDDPDAFRTMVRALLPELNRRDLVPLSRADLVGSMDPQLVRDSTIHHLNATFHFVNLD